MRRVAGQLSFAGLAVAGVVLGHALAYGIAVGDAEVRHALLAETGHGYWLTAVAAALVLGVVATAARIGQLLLPDRDEPGGLGIGFGARLAAAQAALFVALEVGERLTVGASVTHFLGDHLFTLGVALQVATALLVALVLRLLGTTARAVAALLRRPAAAPAPLPVRGSGHPLRPVFPLLAGSRSARGPPSR